MDSNELFFQNNRLNFFGPLTGKYRETAAACIRNLYIRLNGPEADYSYHLSRKDVLDIFAESIRSAPVLEEDDTEEADFGISTQERAIWMLRKLKEAGWIEEYMDSGKMQTAYRFTSYGRQFAIPFAQKHSEIITNTQHTRSTLSHLQSFQLNLKNGLVSVGDLMIATKLSGEIISDFNEIIEEIVEQRRELIASVDKEIRVAKEAGDNFFDFMEKRIIPNISIRFSQDSVERYKNDILHHLDDIRNQPNDVKAAIEQQLRIFNPNLLKADRPSILMWSLNLIEQRLTAACDVKMPELRVQTDSFISRAQVLIHHLASLAFGETDTASVFSLIKRLSHLTKDDIEKILSDERSRHPRLLIEMVNPDKVRPPKERIKRTIMTHLEKPAQTTAEEHRRSWIRQALAAVFRIDEATVSDYVIEQLAGNFRVQAADFPVYNVQSLLGAMHASMVGNVGSAKADGFRVTSDKNRKVDTEYYSGDNFFIELLGDLKNGDSVK